MGIPKFFRWMSERYPQLCQTVRDHQLPEVDNFYLDMNGIIHNCSHPCDNDVNFRLSEQEMFEDINSYVSTLFSIIKPRKYFVMAVDGVAPRAKMNQQRSRRFRSAKEASGREEAALRNGKVLPSEQRFDSNCITPGTRFMVKLKESLEKFVETKLSCDPEWCHVKVILSGHETPGEGEHKIMDFIRYLRSQPDYDPRTRHCLYGLDTDLVMLSLSSHEPYFMLLREEVKFTNPRSNVGGKSGKQANSSASKRVDASRVNFHVLYLSLLRDYIRKDFQPLAQELNFEFDLEKIIDDWVLVCYLVGNDFLPHIPHFHMHKGVLPRIFEIYRQVLPKLDGYLNENGYLDMARFRVFTTELALLDIENFVQLSDPKNATHSIARERVVGGIYHQTRNSPRRHLQNSKNQFTNHSLNHPRGIWHDIKNQDRDYDNNRETKHVQNGQMQVNNTNRYVHGNFRQNSSSSNANQQVIEGSVKVGANGFLIIDDSGEEPDLGRNLSKYIKAQKNIQQPQQKSNAVQRAQVGRVLNSGVGTSTPYRPGVHNYSEKQINSSIKLCADGDFMNLDDGEEDDYDDVSTNDSNRIDSHEALEVSNKLNSTFVRSSSSAQGQSRHSRTLLAQARTDPRASNADHLTREFHSKVRINDRGKVEKIDAGTGVDLSPKVLEDFLEHKKDYYRTKFKVEPTVENVRKIVREYVRALQWNLHYYYHGCVSWGWFYPYHYGPFISDFGDFDGVDLHFDIGEPFKPFDQLLAVLPAASSELLPSVYRSLVQNSDSPLAQFFPDEIQYDLNGKQNDWEAVVLTPFIDESILIKSTTVCNLFLTPEERATNVHGPHLLYQCQLANNPPKKKNGYVDESDSLGAKVVKTEIPLNQFNLPIAKIKFGLLLKPSDITNDHEVHTCNTENKIQSTPTQNGHTPRTFVNGRSTRHNAGTSSSDDSDQQDRRRVPQQRYKPQIRDFNQHSKDRPRVNELSVQSRPPKPLLLSFAAATSGKSRSGTPLVLSVARSKNQGQSQNHVHVQDQDSEIRQDRRPEGQKDRVDRRSDRHQDRKDRRPDRQQDHQDRRQDLHHDRSRDRQDRRPDRQQDHQDRRQDLHQDRSRDHQDRRPERQQERQDRRPEHQQSRQSDRQERPQDRPQKTQQERRDTRQDHNDRRQDRQQDRQDRQQDRQDRQQDRQDRQQDRQDRQQVRQDRQQVRQDRQSEHPLRNQQDIHDPRENQQSGNSNNNLRHQRRSVVHQSHGYASNNPHHHRGQRVAAK